MRATAAFSSFLVFLPGLACLVMMSVCGWMLFGQRKPKPTNEVAELREEVQRLRAERDAHSPTDAQR